MTRKINLTENDIRKMVENVILEYGGFGHADWAAENGKQRQPQQTKQTQQSQQTPQQRNMNILSQCRKTLTSAGNDLKTLWQSVQDQQARQMINQIYTKVSDVYSLLYDNFSTGTAYNQA